MLGSKRHATAPSGTALWLWVVSGATGYCALFVGALAAGLSAS